MIIYPTIALISFFTALLTFFSGFGLGTLLLPVFIAFFPIEIAIAMTAVVHFCNNIFKLGLLYRQVDKPVLFRFSLTALFAAILGAWALSSLSQDAILLRWKILGKENVVTGLKITIGSLMIAFALFEVLPISRVFHLGKKWLPLGGALSGFFGGLSGHQGAFRSLFLLHAGLTKTGFIATGVAIACVIDLGRLAIYGAAFDLSMMQANWQHITVAIFFASLGSLLGQQLLEKVSFNLLQWVVFSLLTIFGILLGIGIF